MAEMLYPTGYTAINALAHELLERIRAVLGDQFRGMYLCGSLALGDFDPLNSDIDVIVVTTTELSETLFPALREMHRQTAAGGTPWSDKIEAVYIPQAALRYSGATLATTRYPQLEKGRTLTMDRLEDGWSVQCYTLREHGVVVAGPDPRTLIDPVDPEEMRHAGAAIVATWLDQARHDPSWLEWLRVRENQSFVVLTLCRVLYTHDTGAVASKPAAARWAQSAVDMRWHGLIERSIVGPHGGGETEQSGVDDTLALIQYTLERCRPTSACNAVTH